MAHYFFDLIQDENRMIDHEGVDLPTTDAMKIVVSRIILDLARDEFEDESHAVIQVVVRDDSDFDIFTAKLNYSSVWN